MDTVVALRRVRRLLTFGSLAVAVVGWAALGWAAAGLPWSVAEWSALLALPVAGAGHLAACALIGSPNIRSRQFWAAVVLVSSSGLLVASAVILKPALDAEPGAGVGRGS